MSANESVFLRRRSKKTVNKNESFVENKEEKINEKNQFKKKEKINESEFVNEPLVLPQHPLTAQQVSLPTVTLFGFSQSNKKYILEQLAQIDELVSISHGDNFVKFLFKNPVNNEKVLEWNRKVVNGEIIGVYESVARVGKVCQERSWMWAVWEYLFGRVN